jgi:hypothetical protein
MHVDASAARSPRKDTIPPTHCFGVDIVPESRLLSSLKSPVAACSPCPQARTPRPILPPHQREARMTKSRLLTALLVGGAVILTSMVTPALAARRHVGWRNAAVAAGIATAAAAASSAYYSGYGFGGYGYGGRYHGRCGGGAYC